MVINLVPKVVDFVIYAGDTLTFTVTAPASLTDGRDWNAQVKLSTDSSVPDATFAITPPASSGGPAYLTLTSASTTALGALAKPGKQYSGVWDCQISAAGSDPVTTLVRGGLIVQRDVTRTP